MKPIQPEELSGLIDGELSAERAAEIRAALQRDPRLQREYEATLKCHASLCSFAEVLSAASEGAPSMASNANLFRSWRNSRAVWLAAGGMLAVRAFDKLLLPAWGVGLSVLALVIVVGGLNWLIRQSDEEAGSEADLRWTALES